MTHAAIIVPGIMGSILELQGEVIWPGSALELIRPYRKMAQLLEPNLFPRDVIRSFSISDQYQNLIDDLGRCGFREDDTPKSLYVFPYDWRKSNADAAQKLASLIDTAVSQNSVTEISLIGHSMGGLICRYYLESGEFSTRSGFSAVRQLITLGTPHRGAPLALNAALGKEKRLFLNKEQVKLLGNDPRYPSLYQLLPPPGEPFAWKREREARLEAFDIYDPAMARVLGLQTQNLDSAKSFHGKLDVNNRPKIQGKPMPYFFFVGTHQKTNTSMYVLQTDPNQFEVSSTHLDGGGDGTVPVWSGSVTGVQAQPVGGEHSTIYKNDVLRRTLAALLGAPGVLAATIQVEVALRERVVHPGDTVHVALSFGAIANRLDGELVVQQLDATGNITGVPVTRHPISYSGLSAESLNVVLTAPGVSGIYRISYFPQGAAQPAGRDDLIVQDI